MRLRDLKPNTDYTMQTIVFNTKDKSLGRIIWTNEEVYGVPPASHSADNVVFVDYSDVLDCKLRGQVLPVLKGKHNKTDIMVERDKIMLSFQFLVKEDEILCYIDYDGHWHPFDKAFNLLYDLRNSLDQAQRNSIEMLFVVSRPQLERKLLKAKDWDISRDALASTIRHITFGHITEEDAQNLSVRLLNAGYRNIEEILETVTRGLKQKFLLGINQSSENIYQFTDKQLSELFKELFNIEV